MVPTLRYGYLDIYVNRTALGDQSGDSSRALRLLVVADMADGSTVTLASGPAGGWMARHGPIVYDHLWHGEIYDARQTAVSASPWFAAVAMQPKAGPLRPQMMEGIKVAESFTPKMSLMSSVCAAPALGGTALEGDRVFLGCSGGSGTIAAIEFVSYGTPLNVGSADCSNMQVCRLASRHCRSPCTSCGCTDTCHVTSPLPTCHIVCIALLCCDRQRSQHQWHF
jgi:hypothetical protein